MDDRDMNPMKTGLMFVPLGLAVSPCHPPARSPDSPTDLEVIEALALQERVVVAQTPRWATFHRLLEYLWRSPRRHVPST